VSKKTDYPCLGLCPIATWLLPRKYMLTCTPTVNCKEGLYVRIVKSGPKSRSMFSWSVLTAAIKDWQSTTSNDPGLLSTHFLLNNPFSSFTHHLYKSSLWRSAHDVGSGSTFKNGFFKVFMASDLFSACEAQLFVSYNTASSSRFPSATIQFLVSTHAWLNSDSSIGAHTSLHLCCLG
jgi:hypothetical protein